MNNLDSAWKFLIVVGVFFLIFYIGVNIFEVISGTNNDFNQKITMFERTTLITPDVKSHLESASDFNSSQQSSFEED